MKELSVEEKAKAYDEAIKRAKEMIKSMTNIGGVAKVDDIQYLFPELKESDDEKIRKRIIALVNAHGQGMYKNEMLTWLEKQGDKPVNIDIESIVNLYKQRLKSQGVMENTPLVNMCLTSFRRGVEIVLEKLNLNGLKKQGEHKPADKVEPKFKVGDWIVYNDDGCICQIKSIREDDYCLWPLDSDIAGYLEITNIDNECHLWTIQDAKDGDVLVASDGSIFLFKGTIDCACKHYVALTTDGTIIFNEGLEHFWETSTAVHPATKEQRDLLFQKMKEAGYEWDADKLELREIEQKPTDTNIDDIKREWYNKGYLEGRKNAHIPARDLGLPKEMDFQNEQKPAEWSEEDENFTKMCVNIISGSAVEYADYIKKEIIGWLKSLKDRVQPRQEWSKEDESILQGIWDEILANKHDAKEYEYKTYDKFLDWLKSLRPQSQHITYKDFEDTICKIKTKIAQCNGFNRSHREEVFGLLDSLRPQNT